MGEVRERNLLQLAMNESAVLEFGSVLLPAISFRQVDCSGGITRFQVVWFAVTETDQSGGLQQQMFK